MLGALAAGAAQGAMTGGTELSSATSGAHGTGGGNETIYGNQSIDYSYRPGVPGWVVAVGGVAVVGAAWFIVAKAKA